MFREFMRGVLGEKSAQPNASASTMTSAPFTAPKDLEEQRSIAHILGTLDDKIELNRRMNRTLEAMAQAIFRDWFVDFGPVRAKLEGREPYLPPELWDLFPDCLVPSELGEVPEGWGPIRLDHLLTAKDRRVGDKEVPEYSSTNTGLHPREERFKKRLSKSQSKNKVINSGDLVFGLSRSILNFGLMRDPVGCVSPAYKVFSIDDKTLSADLAELLIRSPPRVLLRRTLGEFQRGAVNFYYRSRLAQHPIPVSPIQNAFHSLAEPFLVRGAILEDENRALAAQRDALLPKLVSGELGVESLER